MKEVIILGKAQSGRVCPFDAEVWSLNDACASFTGRYFDKLIATDPVNQDGVTQEFVDNLKSYGIPIISSQDYADVRYPIREIEEAFHPVGSHGLYATNTCARAMALALYWGYEKIRLYGIDQSPPFYIYAKGTVEYWIGRAHERGIIVDIQEESCLLKMVKPLEGVCV